MCDLRCFSDRDGAPHASLRQCPHPATPPPTSRMSPAMTLNMQCDTPRERRVPCTRRFGWHRIRTPTAIALFNYTQLHQEHPSSITSRNMTFNIHFATLPNSHEPPGINMAHGDVCEFELTHHVPTQHPTPHPATHRSHALTFNTQYRTPHPAPNVGRNDHAESHGPILQLQNAHHIQTYTYTSHPHVAKVTQHRIRTRNPTSKQSK